MRERRCSRTLRCVSYTRPLRRLELLVRAHEAVTDAMHEAAEDVLEGAKERKRRSPTQTGALTPFRSVDFEAYVRRAWVHAKTDEQKKHARQMLADGVAHGLISTAVGTELAKDFDDE